MTDPLQTLEAQYREAADKAEALAQDRNQEIRRALQTGMSQVQVAKITGLSRQRIQQIEKGN